MTNKKLLSLQTLILATLMFVSGVNSVFAFPDKTEDHSAQQHQQERKQDRKRCNGCTSTCDTFTVQDSTPCSAEEKSGSGEDEFYDFNDSEDEFTDFEEDNDGFEDFTEDGDEEFEAFDEANDAAGTIMSGDIKGNTGTKLSSGLQWVLGILAFTILAGILVRNPKTRKLRVFFLLTSVVILGFYRGACPCPIMSFQNLVLAGAGVDISWQSLVWFLALLPITYFFGKVWCGWICHLGALQEFLFMGKFEILKNKKSQDVLRIVRIVVLAILVIQLLVTKTNIFVHYDPFKVAYNLFSASTLGYVLLGVLLVSSLFINRPFCRTVCPIGLILGWVSLIPGAAVIGVKKGKCAGCNQCSNACKIHAITRENKVSRLVNQDCIACGECMDSCKQHGLKFYTLSNNHPNNITLRNEKKQAAATSAS